MSRSGRGHPSCFPGGRRMLALPASTRIAALMLMLLLLLM